MRGVLEPPPVHATVLGRMHHQQICCNAARGAVSTMKAETGEVNLMDTGVCVGRKKDRYQARS